MDYEFFESLSADQATDFLNRFLELEQKAVEDLTPIAEGEGVHLDYSLSSLPNALKWMMRQVRTRRVPVPEEEPEWIQQAHRDGLIEFDDNSKAVILRAAYYLGECFASLPGMRWTTGNLEYMQKQMPVVTGFCQGLELPPLLVIDNVFARIVGRGAPSSQIDSTVRVWMRDCPSVPT